MPEQNNQNQSVNVPESVQATVEAGRLESLLSKYKVSHSPVTSRASVHQSFDRSANRPAVSTRLGKAPRVSVTSTQTGDIYAEMSIIQTDLAELASEYGKLNVNFTSLLGSNRIFTFTDAAQIGFYKMLGRREKVNTLRKDAAKRKGDAIEFLVNRMSEVLVDQYERAVKGKAYAEAVQLENIAHMRKLDESLIARLRESYVSGADLTAKGDEVKKFESKISEIDTVLEDLELKVQNAKAVGDIVQVRELTDYMIQFCDAKYDVLDGKLAVEGEISESLRQMLSSTEGVQSAKGAAVASKVSYKAITLWIDAMNELVFKYQHAKEDFIPVFQIQGKVAAGGLEAMRMKDVLLRVSEISQELMEANSRLVQRLSTDVFELVETPLYDIERARGAEARLTEYMNELNQLKVKWAEAQQSVTEMAESPHYAKPL